MAATGLRFAANLDMLFTERPLPERFAAARAAGFEAVELLFPYAMPAQALRAALAAQGQTLVLINTPAGDWAAGERGLAAVPGRQEEFRVAARAAIRHARAVPAGRVHVLAGIAQGPRARAAYLDNLAWMAAEAPDVPLSIEPINPVDMPGYFLNGFDQAAAILDELDAPNIGLQFDAYHAHRITGDVLGTWARHGRRAVHVQVAGAEGRHEPQGGQIDYPAFFARLRADGYGGCVSGEYHPKTTTEQGLGWVQLRTT